MSSRYSTIKLDNGTIKRVSKKLIQKAGAPRAVDDIDRDFSTDNKRIDLVLTNQGWVPSAESWYELLEITPDYLINKCAEKGLTDEETQQAIRNWNTRLFDISRPKPTGDAVLGDNKYNPDLPVEVKAAHENYLNTTVKNAERTAYQGCNLAYRRSILPSINKEFCETFMCNPVPYTKPITNEETRHAALHMDNMPENKKQIIRSCYSSGYSCAPQLEYTKTYDPAIFKHVSNSGTGDCLFIAFTNYMTLVEQIGGIFPNPTENNTGLPAIKNPRDNIAQAHKVRLDVVKWLRENPNYLLPNNLTVQQNIAILSIETDPLINILNKAQKISILEDFIRRHPAEAQLLNIRADDSSIKRLEHIVNNVDSFLNAQRSAVQDVMEAALNMIMRVYSMAYLDEMSKQSKYGGQSEITALAVLHNVNIIVLQRDNAVLTHHSGHKVKNPRGTVYIFHNRSVRGVGGLHYEIMFPRTGSPASSLSQPAPTSSSSSSAHKITRAEIDTFVKIGFRVASPTPTSINKFLSGLTGDKLLSVLNVLFKNNMEDMDKLNGSIKDIFYDFIDSALKKLNKEDRDTFLLMIPSLVLRRAEEDLSNWEDDGVADKQLAKIFETHVNKLCRKKPSYLNINNRTISGRLRIVLADILNEPENPVSPEDLLPMTVTDMYEIVNSLIDSAQAKSVQDFFFNEFMDNFFFGTISLITKLNNDTPPLIPGVNQGTDLQSIVNIINIFNEYVDLDDN